MQSYNGIAATDGLNRKNHFMPLSALHEGYMKIWRNGVPTNLNHDSTKLMGWTKFTGIYLEPGKAYITNKTMFPEGKEEENELKKLRDAHFYHAYFAEHSSEFHELELKLGDALTEQKKIAPISAVAYHDEKILFRVFPELAKLINDDGLIELQYLEPVLPGVYKKGDFLVFAHRYFRRSFSIINGLNAEFLERLQTLPNQHSSLNVRIHLDFDLIGLAGTESPELEYAYWWGPHFDDDLDRIPIGVTRHANEEKEHIFSDLQFTEFGWYYQDNHKTLEIEEICDRPTIDSQGESYIGCRYVHSFLNPATNLPTHLDGAIRAYTDEKLVARLDMNLNHTTRDTVYTKLWRIDGDMPVPLWKELITHYYRDNYLIGEYFGGKDEKSDLHRKEDQEKVEKLPSPLSEFIPVTMCSGDGLRVYYHYHSGITMDSYDIQVSSQEFMVFAATETDEEQSFIVEAETITVLKLIQRLGGNIKMPTYTRMTYGDAVLNFPIFWCRDTRAASLVQTAISELCTAWQANNNDRPISYTILINTGEDESVHISFAGHVSDFTTVFSQLGTDFPEPEKFLGWIEKLYHINNKFRTADLTPSLFELITKSGELRFQRRFVPSENIKKYTWNNGLVNPVLQISKETENQMQKYRVSAVPVYIVRNSKCRRCGNEYCECDCIKFVDDTVEEVTSFQIVGSVWTKHPS